MNQPEEFRRQPPAPLAPKPLSLPQPYETALDNGLRLVIVEDKRLPLVSYRLGLRTGNAHDPANLPGLNSMMANLLTEGTRIRTSRQIAEEVERLGATLIAGANADYTTVAASTLKVYNGEIMNLLVDVALHPSFPENELQLSQQNTKQGLVQRRAQPDFLANERLSRTIFGDHPYSVIAPTPESVDAMTRELLSEFHRNMFVPNNAVLIAVGDVERDQVIARAGELFSAWAQAKTTASNFPAPPVRQKRVVYLVDRPGSAQSNIVIANLGITRTSDDYFPMLLLHTILGANASSRLFMNLREEKGYTYGAYSSLDARRTAGSFRVSAEVRSDVTGASLKEFFYELDRIRTEKVSEKELTDAKSYLTGVFPIRLETQEGLIDQLVQIKMFDLPTDYLQSYRERVSAVTADEIYQVAQKYVTPDRVAIVIVGDAAAITDQIKPYAEEIELYDASGERKEMSDKNQKASPTQINSDDIANLIGTWIVEIAAPLGMGNVSAKLKIEREQNNRLSGRVQSPMGTASLNNISVNGNEFKASLAFPLQGQTLDAQITARANDDHLQGAIKVNFPGISSLSFNGRRAAS